MKKLTKMLLILVLLGLAAQAAQAAPVLASLLVIVVMLHYATYAWQTLARIPARQRTELLVLAAIALAAGFLAKLGVGPLIITGVFLIVTLPLWRLAREDPRAGDDVSNDVEETRP